MAPNIAKRIPVIIPTILKNLNIFSLSRTFSTIVLNQMSIFDDPVYALKVPNSDVISLKFGLVLIKVKVGSSQVFQQKIY